jgi:hypothetical protein
MKRTLAVMKLGAVVTIAALAGAGSASAQELRELGNQGYRNGVSSFGGYYETFGGYGGNNTYSGYQRYRGTYAPTTSFFAIPLQAATQTGAPPCSYLKSRAEQTGAKVWRARYQACKRGS